jgi:anti-sigma factor RsiW
MPKPKTHPRDKAIFGNCKQEVDLIGRYLSSDLRGRELAAFETHLAICPDCVAFLKTYKATIALTRKFLVRHAEKDAGRKLSLSAPRKRARGP